MSTAPDLSRLRADLEARFGAAILPGARPERERVGGFAFGVAALDSLLPGGVPRGALSLWTGARSGGRAAALRVLIERASREGKRIALVDAERALEASAWCTPEGPLAGLWVVRPPDAERGGEAAWVAEALLRAGAFDLVVVHGGRVEGEQAHRLRTLARDRDIALVLSLQQANGVRADVALEFRHEATRVALGRYRGRIRVRLTKNGGFPGGEREVESVLDAPDRLRPHREYRDRGAVRR
jgi:hypothetical protein